MIDAFDDIKACTGAEWVGLPSIEDLRGSTCDTFTATFESLTEASAGLREREDLGRETLKQSTRIDGFITGAKDPDDHAWASVLPTD
jgi:hypothetical protein